MEGAGGFAAALREAMRAEPRPRGCIAGSGLENRRWYSSGVQSRSSSSAWSGMTKHPTAWLRKSIPTLRIEAGEGAEKLATAPLPEKVSRPHSSPRGLDFMALV